MSSHNDDHHTSEPKKVQFGTPMIMGIVMLLIILLALSTCDKREHGCCEEGKFEKSCEKDTVTMDDMKSNNHVKTSVVPVEETISGTVDSLGNFIYNVGAIETSYLNDGSEISYGKNSTETKLMTFLFNKDVLVDTVDKTKGWITLDRVYFEKGKSVLTKESETQLMNIVKILKSYPNATVKIGGYTDNTGNEATNVKISGERAAVALKAMVKHGVNASRLKSEGYGAMHPVATNDTPEGMAQNRRVDIKITKK